MVTIKVMIERRGKGERSNEGGESMRVYILCTTLVIAVIRITKRWEKRREDNEIRGRWRGALMEKLNLGMIGLMII